MNRRNFINNGLMAAGAISLPFSLSGFSNTDNKIIRIGMVADIHQDIIHDGVTRLRYFMDDMLKRKPDFLIQLGDFALPRKQNARFLDIWNEFEGPKYHVIGNHDLFDFGYTKSQTMEWWGMEERYYSYDYNGFHFIVLDGNEQNPEPWDAYYPRYIGPEQQKWLSDDLKQTDKPTIVFCHQSLEAPTGGIDNQQEIREILEGQKNKRNNYKVVACFSGHHHQDYIRSINGIPYIQINSMSYKWVGDDYKFNRFGKHIEQAYPAVQKTCPYKDPLYTVLTINPELGTLHLEGMSTEFISPTPSELELPNAEEMKATITESTTKITT